MAFGKKLLYKYVVNNQLQFMESIVRGKYTIFNTVKAQEERIEYINKKHTFQKNKNLSNKGKENNLPVSLRYLRHFKVPTNAEDSTLDSSEKSIECNDLKPVQFPFQNNTELGQSIHEFNQTSNNYDIMKEKTKIFDKIGNWMLNYDNFDDTSLKETKEGSIAYGTPDPKAKISDVPCGGCGAFLHCKDPSLPGYIPSEIFGNSYRKGGKDLTAIICQRCHFLKYHNIALEVQVSEDDYPKVLQTIGAKKNALIVLMVDLTDFPCSIWPGIADIFHKMPIIVVGNKVDLLPKDSSRYLDNIKRKLIESIKSYGFGSTKLIDVILISATTGYGVEKLISTLQKSWKYKGDVYLVGCTNVGKSSLFNILLQSDYCKAQAEDLIQRATTSVWPGTTLNLLKFPISRPSGYKFEQRKERLKELTQLEKFENDIKKNLLRKTEDWKHAVLIGRVDRSTAKNDENEESKDFFSINPTENATGRVKLGINEKNPIFAFSRWCYDTPGVVQHSQITHLLTSEELYNTLAKSIIVPQSFCVKPNESLFIGGLGRLDLLEGPNSLRLTVFCSENLPISLCETTEADQFYRKYLGSGYLKVPSGGKERLEKWPGLTEAKTFTVIGISLNFASKDVILSNAGWISICGRKEDKYTFKAWTPEKRGVYLRDSLLPQAVNLRGPRIRYSPAYKLHKYFEEKKNYIYDVN